MFIQEKKIAEMISLAIEKENYIEAIENTYLSPALPLSISLKHILLDLLKRKSQFVNEEKL